MMPLRKAIGAFNFQCGHMSMNKKAYFIIYLPLLDFSFSMLGYWAGLKGKVGSGRKYITNVILNNYLTCKPHIFSVHTLLIIDVFNLHVQLG